MERREGPHRLHPLHGAIYIFDREIISHIVVANAGISGSDIRDITLEAIELRFGGGKAPNPVEHFSDNGSCYTAKDIRDFATA